MRVYLIGVGTVGREILKAHLAAGIPICIADQNELNLRETTEQLGIQGGRLRRTMLGPLAAIEIDGRRETAQPPTIVIESISERLDLKQAFFQTAEKIFDDDAILCSNTSTLRISHIAAKLKCPHRLCGMHFFMPVDQRNAVEIVRGEQTDADAIEACLQHARLINKTPIVVADGPGFIVNRLLCPYLNQALLMLGRGVTADQLGRAARNYGMPMSALELMDWIGTRTMFDAGRVFWQSFPSRFEPSPILPALVKAERLGRECGRGCFDYQNGQRSAELSPATVEICRRYQRGDALRLTDEDVMLLLAIPMWIEAAHAYRDRVPASLQQIDLAMRGGLGYQSDGTWLEFFDSVGSQRMLRVIQQHAHSTKSLQVHPDILAGLEQHGPTRALEYAASCTLQHST